MLGRAKKRTIALVLVVVVLVVGFFKWYERNSRHLLYPLISSVLAEPDDKRGARARVGAGGGALYTEHQFLRFRSSEEEGNP